MTRGLREWRAKKSAEVLKNRPKLTEKLEKMPGRTRKMKNRTDTTLMISTDYRQFIEELKARVIGARISAARRVNHELILLYWDIGRGIVEKQQALGWGESVVEMVAADLRQAFPSMSGFSPRNV